MSLSGCWFTGSHHTQAASRGSPLVYNVNQVASNETGFLRTIGFSCLIITPMFYMNIHSCITHAT
jgi:hypothetical protein